MDELTDEDWETLCYDFFPSLLTIPCVAHVGLPGLMTPLCLPLKVRFFLMAITFYVRILTQQWRGSLYLYCASLSMFTIAHVYKCSKLRLRNSKRVLFCTNTSRRQTCPFLILWTPILRKYLTSKFPKSRITVSQLRLSDMHDDYA